MVWTATDTPDHIHFFVDNLMINSKALTMDHTHTDTRTQRQTQRHIDARAHTHKRALL